MEPLEGLLIAVAILAGGHPACLAGHGDDLLSGERSRYGTLSTALRASMAGQEVGLYLILSHITQPKQ